MLRTRVLCAFVTLLFLMPLVTFASPYSDLLKAKAAFLNLKSWQADEHFSNGKTTTVDYSAPDRWRVQARPDMADVIIGHDIYLVHNGKATKLPFGGGMIQKMVKRARFSVSEDVKQSIRDLGMQTLDGQRVHAYSFVSRGVPVKVYIRSDSLPVEAIVKNKKRTTTIKYSRFNAPISIEP